MIFLLLCDDSSVTIGSTFLLLYLSVTIDFVTSEIVIIFMVLVLIKNVKLK